MTVTANKTLLLEMPFMTEYLYISADNHLDTHWCPKGLWQDRLPAKFREIGPKVIEGENGSQWTWEGSSGINQRMVLTVPSS